MRVYVAGKLVYTDEVQPEPQPPMQQPPRVPLSGLLGAMAAPTNSAFDSLWSDLMTIADWLAIGVFMFAGATWMFGNRTQAIERMIGGATGYLVIRHAKTLQEWLAHI